MTAAPELKPTRHARRTAHIPRPLPVWLQVGAVLFLLWNGLQAIVHLNGPSLAANTDQAAPSNAPLLWTEGYDLADQLTSAALTNTAIASPAVRSDSYGYDAAGNATTFNVGGVARSPSYNALNQLTG